jgi:4-hydroxy-tetrahydrodipicolinate synthase
MEGYIRRMLWVLVHQGVIPAEAAHDPWGPGLPQSGYEEVGRMLAALQGVGD